MRWRPRYPVAPAISTVFLIARIVLPFSWRANATSALLQFDRTDREATLVRIEKVHVGIDLKQSIIIARFKYTGDPGDDTGPSRMALGALLIIKSGRKLRTSV